MNRPPITPGWDFPSERINLALEERRPLQVSLWLGNRCNLRCVYCFRDAGEALPNELRIEEYLDLVDQAKGIGAEYIFVSGSGEPTCDRNLLPILRHARDLSLGFVLVTNLTLIDERLANELADSGASVIGKLNSLQPDLQNKLAGNVPWAYDRIMRGLNLLLDAGMAESTPTRLGVETPILPSNYQEIPDIWVYARDRNMLPVVELLSNTGRASLLEEISVSQAQALFEELLHIDEERYGFTWTPTPPYAGFQCQRFLYNLVVDSQGYVLPCFGVEERVGNIRTTSLKDIWQSPALERNRNVRQHVKGTCASCKIGKATGCYGCRGRMHVVTGDMFSCDVSCWHACTNSGEPSKHGDMVTSAAAN